MAFELPDLPYAHDALADAGMSKETLEYHHDLHHKAYVDNGNKLIEGTEWAGKSLEEIITRFDAEKQKLKHLELDDDTLEVLAIQIDDERDLAFQRRRQSGRSVRVADRIF